VIPGAIKRDLNWLESGVNTSQAGYRKELLDQAIATSGIWGQTAQKAEGFRAVGHKFAGNDIWAQIPLVLVHDFVERSMPMNGDAERFGLDTQVYTAGGERCGAMPVDFSRNLDGKKIRKYVVDQYSIGEIIGVIANCAQ